MSLTFADRINRIQPSPTIALTAKAAELRAAGEDILTLTAGEPDFAPPECIQAAAIEAVQQGFSHYTAVDGLVSLKSAIIEKFQRDNNLSYSANQIIVSCGAKHSIFNALMTLLSEGKEEEVIIPAPYWVSYPDMVALSGGKPVIVETSKSDHFKLTPEALEKAITAKTRLLILNGPSNPSGMAYTAEELKALGAVLEQHPDVLILSDDIYEHILWEGGFVNLPMVCPSLQDRTLVINGVSKAFAMTGWRIGYAAGPEAWIKAMKKLQSQSTSNPCAVAQKAAEAALLMPLSEIAPMMKAFKERHDYLYQALNQIPGIHCLPADGTFYLFPSVEGLIEAHPAFKSDHDVAAYWLSEKGIAAVPGSCFGAPGMMRLSFATSMDVLEGVIQRLQD